MNDASHLPQSAQSTPSAAPQHDATSSASATPSPTEDAAPALSPDDALLHNGLIVLDRKVLRSLRLSRLMSQRELVIDFSRRRIHLSIATIKRVECGHPVRFRTARQLSCYYEVSLERLFARAQPGDSNVAT